MGVANTTELFQSDELIGELKDNLAERFLDALWDVHLAQEQGSDDVRNGHNM